MFKQQMTLAQLHSVNIVIIVLITLLSNDNNLCNLN